MRKTWILLVALVWFSPVLQHDGEAAESSPNIKVLMTNNSVTGHTEKMAKGVVAGAQAVPGTTVVLKPVGKVTAADLLSADALIVGSPVYWSNMAGQDTTFFDHCKLNIGVLPGSHRRAHVGAAFTTGRPAASA